MVRIVTLLTAIGFAALAHPAVAFESGEASPEATPCAACGASESCGACEACVTCGGWCAACENWCDWIRVGNGNGNGNGNGEDEPLVTDRPDFTEASSVVGHGRIQLETGYTFVYNDSEDDGTITRTHGGPETLLRIGWTDHFEFRIFWNYLWERSGDEATADTLDGAEDLVLGAKIALWEQCCALPETAFIVQFTVPTGANAFSNQDVTVGVNLLYSWEMPGDWTLGGSTGYANSAELISITLPALLTPADFLDHRNVVSQSLTVGVPITERIGMYAEGFAFFTEEAVDNRPQYFVNGGFTFLVNNDLQLDIRAGEGLNDASDDLFAGVGLSVRR